MAGEIPVKLPYDAEGNPCAMCPLSQKGIEQIEDRYDGIAIHITQRCNIYHWRNKVMEIHQTLMVKQPDGSTRNLENMNVVEKYPSNCPHPDRIEAQVKPDFLRDL